MEEHAMTVLNPGLSSISLAALLAFSVLALDARADQCDNALPKKDDVIAEVIAASSELDAVVGESDKTSRCKDLKELVGRVAYTIETTYNPDFIKEHFSTCSKEQIEGSRAPLDQLFKRIEEKRVSDGCSGF
jgi:hypothetical protein